LRDCQVSRGGFAPRIVSLGGSCTARQLFGVAGVDALDGAMS